MRGRIVICSRCVRGFSQGVTRVKNCVVFNFCAPCHSFHRNECEAFMEAQSAVDKPKAQQKPLSTETGLIIHSGFPERIFYPQREGVR